MNWVEGIAKGDTSVETPLGILQVTDSRLSGPVRLGIRPYDIQISKGETKTSNALSGSILDELFLGEQVQLSVKFKGDVMMDVKVQKRVRDAASQSDILCHVDPDDILVFPKSD
jgi:ABC-type Fe3+/spermidine/putrescine transport system ATPase subunit